MKRLLVCAFVLTTLPGCPTFLANRPAASAKQQPATPSVEEYPHPECGVVVAHLKKTLADPSVFDVVWWGARREKPEGSGRYQIELKYRAKNEVGAKALYWRFVTVDGERIVDGGVPIPIEF